MAYTKEQKRLYNLRYRYGITPEEYDKLYIKQHGCCAICGALGIEEATLRVDHDHRTGAIRGLLCNECNFGLGKLGDTLEMLKRATKYLQRTKCQIKG